MAAPVVVKAVVAGPLVVLWQRFGPYHHARFKALESLRRAVGLQCSQVDSTYAWQRVASKGLVTLFEDRSSQDVPPNEIRRTLARVLGSLGPCAVAIPGWSDRVPLAALEWCRDHHVPAVLMSPSQRDDAPRVWHKEWVKGRIVRLFSAALVGGAPQARYLRSLGFPGERIVFGYNAVDNRYFQKGAARARRGAVGLRRALKLPKDFFLVSVRFVPKKNLENFLEAYRVYVEELGRRAWKLVLLGDGPLRARLEASVVRWGLSDFVSLPGFKQYHELPDYYGLARALALPSSTEQWGLVVNEAMASRLPVLVSKKCGCVEDLVKDGVNGFLLDPQSVAQMASVLRRATQQAPNLEAMGKAGAAIIAGHGVEAFAQGLSRATDWAMEEPARGLGGLDRGLLRFVMRGKFKGYQDQ